MRGNYQTMEPTSVDTRRWAKTSSHPQRHEQPDPLSPPLSDDGQKYGQTSPSRATPGESDRSDADED